MAGDEGRSILGAAATSDFTVTRQRGRQLLAGLLPAGALDAPRADDPRDGLRRAG